jgi:hypothetical protein
MVMHGFNARDGFGSYTIGSPINNLIKGDLRRFENRFMWANKT